MENSKTYKAKVYCKNCDLNQEIDIPKGVKIDETACPNCGTTELEKYVNVNLGNQGSYYDNGYRL